MGFLRSLNLNPEDPNTNLAGWLNSNFHAQVVAGVSVTPRTSMQQSAVYAAVRVIAETIATLPLVLFKRTGERKKEKAINHPLFRLLNAEPNPVNSSVQYIESQVLNLLLWGNAYSEIERNTRDQIIAIWPVESSKVSVCVKDREKIFTFQLLENNSVAVGQRNILHIPGLGFDGLIGFSPIRMLARSVGLAMATDIYGESLYKNGVNPSGVLESPGKLSELALTNLKGDLDRRHAGLGNTGRPMVLQEGMKWSQTSIPPADAQFIETRNFQRKEIAAIYRVPPHMIGDLEKATFSNIEQQAIDFVIHTIRPWLVRLEKEFERALLTPAERNVYFIKFRVDALLRGDTKTRFESYRLGRAMGIYSANDVLELEDRDSIPDGDTYMVPLNMTPSDKLGKDDE